MAHADASRSVSSSCGDTTEGGSGDESGATSGTQTTDWGTLRLTDTVPLP